MSGVALLIGFALLFLFFLNMTVSGLRSLFRGRSPSGHYTTHIHVHNSFNRSEVHAANRIEEEGSSGSTASANDYAEAFRIPNPKRW